MVLFVVVESYVAFIMVSFCLFLHSFQPLVFIVVNTCAFWPLKFQAWICIYLQIEKIYKKCLPLSTNEFFKKLKIFLIGYWISLWSELPESIIRAGIDAKVKADPNFEVY